MYHGVDYDGLESGTNVYMAAGSGLRQRNVVDGASEDALCGV